MSLWSRGKTDAAPKKPPRVLQGQTNQDDDILNPKQDVNEPETAFSPQASLTSGTSSGFISLTGICNTI